MIVVVGLRNCRREVWSAAACVEIQLGCVCTDHASTTSGNLPVQELRSRPIISALSPKKEFDNIKTTVDDGAGISPMTLHSRAPILISTYKYLMTAFDIRAYLPWQT